MPVPGDLYPFNLPSALYSLKLHITFSNNYYYFKKRKVALLDFYDFIVHTQVCVSHPQCVNITLVLNRFYSIKIQYVTREQN